MEVRRREARRTIENQRSTIGNPSEAGWMSVDFLDENGRLSLFLSEAAGSGVLGS